MKYFEFLDWVRAAQVEYPQHANDLEVLIKTSEVSFDGPYYASMKSHAIRQGIESLITALGGSVYIKAKGRSLGQMYEDLDPDKFHGQEFIADLKQEFKQYSITCDEMIALNKRGAYEGKPAFTESAKHGFFEAGAGGMKQFKKDFYNRNFELNGNTHLGLIDLSLDPEQLRLTRSKLTDSSNDPSDEDIKAAVKRVIGLRDNQDELVDHFIAAHSQGVGSFASFITNMSLAGLFDGTATVKIKQADEIRFRVFQQGGSLYIKAIIDAFPIVSYNDPNKQIGVLTGPVETTFKLQEKDGNWGYQLVRVDTNNPDILRAMKGEELTSEELIAKYSVAKKVEVAVSNMSEEPSEAIVAVSDDYFNSEEEPVVAERLILSDDEESDVEAVAVPVPEANSKQKEEVVYERVDQGAPQLIADAHVDATLINNALLAVEALYHAKVNKKITASQLIASIDAIFKLTEAAKNLLPNSASSDDVIIKIKDAIYPFLNGVKKELIDIDDVENVLNSFDAKILSQVPGSASNEIDPAVMAIKQCAAAIAQVQREVYGDPALHAAKKGALKVMLRLQALNVDVEVTDDISDFYQAMLRFNATIPGGFDALKFAENLKAVLPRDRVFHSDAMLAKLDKLDQLYQPDADAGQFKSINMEVYQALNTFKHDETLAADTVPADVVEMAKNDIQVEDDPKVKSLLEACDDYLIHLGKAIYAEIRDADFELCKTLVSRPDANSKLRFDIRAVINADGVVKDRIDAIKRKSVTFDLALQKYQAVHEMKTSLVLDGQPVQQKLHDFSTKFTEMRGLIETRRDSGAMKFLKVVASVLALVVSAVAGPMAGATLLNKLWKIKGEKKAKEIDSILNEAPKNNNPRK